MAPLIFGTLVVGIAGYSNLKLLGRVGVKVLQGAAAVNIAAKISVAAPMAYFPFIAWGGSFLGHLHAQERDAIKFYTEESCCRTLAQDPVAHVLVTARRATYFTMNSGEKSCRRPRVVGTLQISYTRMVSPRFSLFPQY